RRHRSRGGGTEGPGGAVGATRGGRAHRAPARLTPPPAAVRGRAHAGRAEADPDRAGALRPARAGRPPRRLSAAPPDGRCGGQGPVLASPEVAVTQNRAVRALRRPANWVQLFKFGVVGASGYVVNLTVYTSLLRGVGFHYLAAATCSFVVAASWNYWWNR